MLVLVGIPPLSSPIAQNPYTAFFTYFEMITQKITTFHSHFIKIFHVQQTKLSSHPFHHISPKKLPKIFHSPKSSYFSKILTFFQKIPKNFHTFPTFVSFFSTFSALCATKKFPNLPISQLFQENFSKNAHFTGLHKPPKKLHLFHPKFHW